MCVAWRYRHLLVVMLTMKVYRSKYYSSLFQNSSSRTSTNPCFPLQRAYLFTFMLSHHPLIKKALVGEHRCHLHALLLVYIEYDCDWISFTMNQNVQSVLELQRCSAFMFCGLRKGQRDTILLYHIMIVLRKCCHPRFTIIARQLIMPLI